MRGFLIALAACGSSAAPRDEEPAPIPSPRPLALIRGSHGGTINALAVTADGRAAVSGDTTGGLRLWPTLDGTQEPIVIEGAVAAMLAIGHDGGGFAIAIADAADRVELVRVDARGHVRSRRPLGEAAQVEIVGDRVLLLRVDQVIELLALDGAPLGRVPAIAGSSVKALMIRDGAVLALVATEEQVHVRELALAPLAWGDPSAPLAIAADAVAVLSSDRRAIVARAHADGRISRFDLETGKQQAACPASTHGARLRGFGEGVTPAEPIAVIGDDTACIVDGVLSWQDGTTGAITTVPTPRPAQPVFAAASDRVVFGVDHQLAIHTAERIDYLGYGFRDLTHVRPVPIGLVIDKGDQQPVLLDENFRERARFALPKLRAWTDLVPLDERFLIASSTRPSGDLWGNAYEIAIYDSVKQAMHQVLPQRARTGELAYEPATRMLVVTDSDASMLLQLDAEKHTFGNPITLALPAGVTQIALLEPRLAGGLVAIALNGGGKRTVFELHRDDIPARTEDAAPRTLRPRKTYELSGDVRAIDRAGRVYLVDGDAIDVRASGRSVARLPGVHTARIRPSPDAKHVVTIDGGTITLFQADGTRRWETAAWGVSDVDWLPSGEIYARFPQSLARLDLATGALRERQCGWAFGISAVPHALSTTAPSVCDVAP